MGKKKAFIDKKNAITFHVVHRSQRDPLAQADEGAAQHVLLPAGRKQKEEERKFGIFYDDDYDYLQHLKDVNEVTFWAPSSIPSSHPVQNSSDGTKATSSSAEAAGGVAEDAGSRAALTLPSSVFGTASAELGTGMLEKAAPHSGPRVDWDPDIVAALDEDFDYDNEENILDDDFVLRANQPVGEDDQEECADSGDSSGTFTGGSDEEDGDKYKYGDKINKEIKARFFEQMMSKNRTHSLSDFEDDDDADETKTQFTEYSLTSSVIRRTEGLRLLDDRFEQMYVSEYGDRELGPLDGDLDIEDPEQCPALEGRLLEDALAEYGRRRAELSRTLVTDTSDMVQLEEDADSGTEREETEAVAVEEKVPQEERWDCQSILSTYSTLYNRPTVIDGPRTSTFALSKRARRRQQRPSAGSDAASERSQSPCPSACSSVSLCRPPGETPQERRDRKRMVKEFRRERRQEKKANKVAFREEETRQQKQEIQATKSLKSVKIDDRL